MKIRRSLVTAAGMLVAVLLASSGTSGIPAQAGGLPGAKTQQVSAAAGLPGARTQPSAGLPG